MKTKNKNLMTLEDFKEKTTANAERKNVMNWKPVTKTLKSQ